MTRPFYPRPPQRKFSDEASQAAFDFYTLCVAGDAPGCEKTSPELRTYEIPGFVVEEEHEMLARYNAENWQELLDKARSTLNSVFSLLRRFDNNASMDGDSINRMAENLMARPIGMLHDLCAVVGYFTVHEPENKAAG